MRIVAGQFRGRALAAPEGAQTRPTSDRVREALFNVLEHGIADFSVAGQRVLDLFAGTGALGLEALSRGAVYCLFVEEDAAARGPAGKHAGFGLAFLDPPYEQGLAERALASAGKGGWLAPGAVIAIEESKRASIALPPGFQAIDQRTWGETQVVLARFAPA